MKDEGADFGSILELLHLNSYLLASHVLKLGKAMHRPNSGLIGRFRFPWVPFRLNQKVWGSSAN